MSSVSLSLIVPTYNRAAQLYKSIPTFLSQDLSPNQYEIIVVDNNSTDDTPEVVRKLFVDARCQCTYVHEPNQGLHHARNRGIKEAVGDIAVFGDDDILATSGWLSALAREFSENPNTGVAGRRIRPEWDEEPPEWVFDYGSSGFHGVFAFLDLGDDRLILKDGSVFGCNFAVRKDLVVKTGGSYPDTFPRRLRHLSGTGEYAIADNVRREGFEVVYLPGADVFHLAERSRATLEYFIDRHERWAVENIFEGGFAICREFV